MSGIAAEVGGLLRKRSLTLSVAESCTGGKIGDMLTEVPGSSDYFLGGIVSYSNQAKVDLLGVKRKSLDSVGAVSEEVAIQMVSGAIRAFGSDVAVSTTGIAGPTGATAEKPVGLVYIAVGSEKASVCAREVFKGDRSAVKEQAAVKALEMLKDFLLRQK
ncbi:MAG: CinA family protein [Thermoplasmata archaeon]|nr:CinA family protein [Thermoplasmata archaeon]